MVHLKTIIVPNSIRIHITVINVKLNNDEVVVDKFNTFIIFNSLSGKIKKTGNLFSYVTTIVNYMSAL